MDARDFSDLMLQASQSRDENWQRFLSEWHAKDIQLMKAQIKKLPPEVKEQLRQVAPEQMDDIEKGG